MPSDPDRILEVAGLSKSFGGIRAVDGLTFGVSRGETLGLIGPNGAGKTTVFNLITGIYAPDAGRILLDGQQISGLTPPAIVRRGVARTFQNLRLFNNLSVLDNVKTALHDRPQYGLLEAFVRTGRVRREDAAARKRALDLLNAVGIGELAGITAKNLPYGLARKLELARALALEPRVLLLDEPAAGMNAEEIRELAVMIRFVKKEFNLTIILIEHRMDLVMSICERMIVLNFGAKLAEGGPDEIQANQHVQDAYLGEEYRNAER